MIILYILSAYLIIINIIGFAKMGIDKKRAANGKWRISEASLFQTAIFGGSVGSILGMKYFHHKTNHWYFKYGMPAILIIQIILICLLNRYLIIPNIFKNI